MNPSTTELTTAATDAVFGALCVVLLLRLRAIQTEARWTRTVWTSVFAFTVLASALGATVHGLALAEAVRSALWHPLNLSLGLAVALFLVGAVAEWRGEASSRTVAGPAIAAGVAFFVLTVIVPASFALFIAYEAVVMTSALAVYLILAMARHRRGAGTVSVGIALTLVASVVQVTRWTIRIGVPFDHNGLFHVVQMVATPVLAHGIGVMLTDRTHRGSVIPATAAAPR
jgi:uncharacterized protein DUF6962